MDRKAEFIAEPRSKPALRADWISWPMEDRFKYLKARFPEFSDQGAVQVYLYKDLKPSESSNS